MKIIDLMEAEDINHDFNTDNLVLSGLKMIKINRHFISFLNNGHIFTYKLK